MAIKALFKFTKLSDNVMVIDTTFNTGAFRYLSPFILPASPARNFENLWQFSKVYKEHLNFTGEPNDTWRGWQKWGFSQDKAYRYPMGKGKKPEYSWWRGLKLDYIEARKKIYAPIYAENVIKTSSYQILKEKYEYCQKEQVDLVLLDYDAYDHASFGMTLVDVINYPNKKMGHSFVLLMMLTNTLEECVNSMASGKVKQGIAISPNMGDNSG